MADTTTAFDLGQQVAELRATVVKLEAAIVPRLSLAIRAAPKRVFLGQPVTLTITAQRVSSLATDAVSTPAGDVPITVITNWGHLRSVDAYATEVGTSVRARTGLDGVARVTLLPAGADQFSVAQQSALRVALERLDLGTSTPADLQAGLADLTAQYRWEANLLLRRAIDILFRENGQPSLDTINPEDELVGWPESLATLIAFAGETPEETGATTPMAGPTLCTVGIIDWLRPWLQVYLQQTQAEQALARDLAKARQHERDPGTLLENVYAEIHKYVRNEYGVIGQVMGQRAAENALRTFVSDGLADLPSETRVTLFPTLHVAAETIATTRLDVLSALTQARVDLRQEIDTKAKGMNSDFSGRLGILKGNIAAKLDTDAFHGFQAELDSSLASLSDRTGALATQLTSTADATAAIQTNLSGIKASLGQLDTQLGTLQSTLGQLGGRLSTVQEDLTQQLARRVTADEFSAFQDSTTAALKTKANAATIAGLRAELTAQIDGKADQAALNELQRSTDGRLAELADSSSKMAAQVDDLNRSVVQIDNKVGSFQRDLAVQLEANQAVLAQTQASIAELQGSVGSLSTNLNTRIAGLETQTRQVTTNLTNFQKSLSGLNRDFTVLNKRITDSGFLRPP